MIKWKRFELAGHRCVAFLLSSREEPQVFALVVTKSNQEVRQETISLPDEPIFGPDVGDVVELNARVKTVIREPERE